MNDRPTPSFDPHDPDLGTSYRKDVVRDVTDFRSAERPRSTDQDRISRLEDRLAALESLLQEMLNPRFRPLTPADHYGRR